jgi:hypothetical protein
MIMNRRIGIRTWLLIVFVILLFAPFKYVVIIWDFVSPYNIFGIPLWVFIAFGLYFVIFLKKKNSSGVSTTGSISATNVLATAMAAEKFLKKPSVSSEDPDVEIISVNRQLTGWEISYRHHNYKVGIQKQKFSSNTTSLSTGSFKIKWR